MNVVLSGFASNRSDSPDGKLLPLNGLWVIAF
jgi:hypothetical protein